MRGVRELCYFQGDMPERRPACYRWAAGWIRLDAVRQANSILGPTLLLQLLHPMLLIIGNRPSKWHGARHPDLG
jgi:hypothetical protein